MDSPGMKIKRLIFLDFDGVIVTTRTKYMHFDRECVDLLKEIVDATDAFIVISSSWKIGNSFRTLKAMFEPFGLFQRVIDTTPNIKDDWGRGKEIDQWITEMTNQWNRLELESFIILDDDSDMEPHMDRLVQTKWDVGLTKKDVEKAIEMLNGDEQ